MPEITQDEIFIDDGRLYLLKTAGSDARSYKFAGIASDESADDSEYSESLLRNVLDLSYASKRGFVNWNHSREPEDQIGFLTKAVLIAPKEVKKYADTLGVPLRETATVYVEGGFYKHVKKVEAILDIMTSVEPGEPGMPGLSVDGSSVRDAETHQMLKAIIRGVAVTPFPAQVNTFCMLKKSLFAPKTPEILAGLSREQAIFWILEQRQGLPLTHAKAFVDLVFSKRGQGQ